MNIVRNSGMNTRTAPYKPSSISKANLKSPKMEPPLMNQVHQSKREIDLKPQIIKASTEGETIGAAPEKQQGGQSG